MGQDVIMFSAVCSFALHLQAAVEVILHLRVSEQNGPTPVRKLLNLTHAGLGKIILCGVGLTSLINVWSLEAFSRYSMLHLYSAHCVTPMPDWAGLFSSSNAAGTNECLDLSCCSCPPSGDRCLSYTRCSGS